MIDHWYELTCNNCGKKQNLPFNESPFTCYDCKMKLEHGSVLEEIMRIITKYDGLRTEDIALKIGKDYRDTDNLLNYLQSDCKIQCLFDDEVTYEDRWHLYS